MIDLNAAAGCWPFSIGQALTPEQLSNLLRQLGVQQAHVSAVEAILAPDPVPATRRLADQIADDQLLCPAAVIDPTLPTALKDLSHLADNWPIKLVKLYPGFGDYPADDDRAVELVRAAAQKGMASAVVIRVEDDRNQRRLLQTRPVAVDELTSLAQKVLPLPLLILNATRPEIIKMLPDAANLMCDMAFYESWSSVPDLLEHVPLEQVVFGSNAPFFYPQAAAAKLANPELSQEQRRAVATDNAQALWSMVQSNRR